MEETVEKVEQTGLIKYEGNIKTKRNSNLEILRIISMIMIIAHHYIVHSDIKIVEASILNQYLISFLELGGKVGVNIFVLITGYFMIQKKFDIKKTIKLIIKVLIYSIICLIIAIYKNSELLNIATKVSSFIPIITNEYWFITTYFLMYLFHPYINKLFFILKKKELEKLFIGIFVIWAVIPIFTLGEFGFSTLLWFMFIYMLGGYLKIYGNPFLENKKINIIAIILIIILLTIIPVEIAEWKKVYEANNDGVKNILKLYLLKKGIDIYNFNTINSAFILILSVSFFSIFKNRKPIRNKILNSISKHTLGVYLMHDNPFIRDLLWKDIIHCNTYIKSKIFILNATVVIPAIFIICLIIDYIVDFVFERNIYKIVDKILIKRIIKKKKS